MSCPIAVWVRRHLGGNFGNPDVRFPHSALKIFIFFFQKTTNMHLSSSMIPRTSSAHAHGKSQDA